MKRFTVIITLLITVPIIICVALEDSDSDWAPKPAGYAIIYAEVRGLYNQLGDQYYYRTYHRSFGDCADTHWSFQGYTYVDSIRLTEYIATGGSWIGYYTERRTFGIQVTEAMSYAEAYAWPWGAMTAVAWIGPPGTA